MHPGQDFAVPVGTPVKAMSTGTVIFAGWQGGYGNKVEIQYWDGTVSWFAHNSKLLVTQGENVTPGRARLESGNTGHSTGPHVHVEIHPAATARSRPSRGSRRAASALTRHSAHHTRPVPSRDGPRGVGGVRAPRREGTRRFRAW